MKRLILEGINLKKYYMLSIVVLIFLCTFCPYKEVQGQEMIVTLQSEIINFNDKNLETGIRDKINKPKGDITKDDVKIIENLTLNHKNISSLDGIQYLINLKKLNLMFNDINDISPLNSLSNLKSLNISHNEISDISSLRSLPGLELTNIDFSGNPFPNYIFTDKLNQEFILNILSPYIESAINQYYGEYRLYMNAGILSTEKLDGKYRLKIRVETFVGPHNPPYGIETIIITEDFSGIKVEDFKHEDIR